MICFNKYILYAIRYLMLKELFSVVKDTFPPCLLYFSSLSGINFVLKNASAQSPIQTSCNAILGGKGNAFCKTERLKAIQHPM